MPLGSELAPHLPFLRRYARALTGTQVHGDAFVRATLEAIVAAPESFPRDVDPRLGLYRTFHAIWSSANIEAEPGYSGSGSPEDIAQARLSLIAPLSRQALLLTAMEGFTPDDAGYLLGTTSSEIEGMVAEALAEIERQTRANVLIIEDEPIIAMDIETIVRDLGHRVTGVAVTRTEAVAKAFAQRPGLILADIQLADDSSGIDAVRDILARIKVPVIFITAFPERLLTGERPEPTFLITKPFQRTTVKAAIAQALFFDTTTVPDEETEADTLSEAASEPALSPPMATASISDAELRPRPGPVNAEMVGGKLRLSPTQPTSATPHSNLEAVRKLHLATAKRLSAALAGSNIGPSFNSRLEAIQSSLSRPISEESALRLGIQSRGLENMKPLIDERLDDVTAVDVITFVDDISDFTRQFPAYLSFLREAQAFDHVTPGDEQAMIQVSSVIESQPDDLVDPALKEAMAEVRSNILDNNDPAAAFALLRSLGNVLRAIARFLIHAGSQLSAESGKSFTKVGGIILGGGLALVVFGAPLHEALIALATRYPGEFGFILDLLKLLKDLAL